MSLVKDMDALYGKGFYSYSWSFGMALASVAVALIGSIISTIGLFKSLRETKLQYQMPQLWVSKNDIHFSIWNKSFILIL